MPSPAASDWFVFLIDAVPGNRLKGLPAGRLSSSL